MNSFQLKVGALAIAVSFFFASCTSNGMNTFGGSAISGGAIGGIAGSGGASGGGTSGGGTLTGSVAGGLSPVAGATVNLMAAGTETPVATATTASDGSFSFDFTKPSTPSLLFVIVSGGNAGGASSKNLQMAGLVGSSDKVPSNTEINELTTAAFSELMFDFGLEKISKDTVTFSAPGNPSAMANVVAEWKNLIAANGKLNTSNQSLTKTHQDAMMIIANAVAACVEKPSTCDALFSAASNTGGTAASNLLESVANMLTVNADLTPVHKIAEPFAAGTGFVLNGATPPGSLNVPLPASSTTVAVGASPIAAAIDSKGNVWITSKSGLTKIPSNGKNPTNYNVGPLFGLAIDSQGNLWSTSGNHVIEITSAGKTAGSFPVGTDASGLTIDNSGNLWVANSGSGDVTVLNGSGSSVGRYSVSGSPYSISIDSKGNAWIVNNSSPGSVTELSSTGSPMATVSVGKNPRSMAIDASGNLWVANNQSDTLSKLSPKGAMLGNFAVTAPEAVIIDSDGQIWVTNAIKNGTVTELESTSNVSIGNYPVGNLPAGIVMDSSGNLWVANSAESKVTKINKVAAGPNTFPYQGPQYASSSF